MPTWLWWFLAGTVFIGIITMIVSFVVTRKKIVKIRNSYLSQMTENEIKNSAKAFERNNHGKILKELKPKDKICLGDIELEFSFNSFFRNGYKTFKIFNADSNYEEQSFKKILNAKLAKETKYDFALVVANNNLLKDIKNIYNNLNEKGLIIISNVTKKAKQTKDLIYDLKILDYRYEWQDLGKGIILIAK